MTNNLTLFGGDKNNQISLRDGNGGNRSLKINGKNGSSSGLLKRVQERNKESSLNLDILFGLDYTGSTSSVVNKFKNLVNDILLTLNKEYPNSKNFFGTMSDRGIEISKDVSIINKQNYGAASDVPKFMKTALNNFLSTDNSVSFIFGDEIDCPQDGCYHNPKDLQYVINELKQRKSPLFFIYENTGGGGNTRQDIERMLIKPLGEFGFLLDMKSVDISNLLEIISGCLSFVAKKKIISTINGKNNLKKLSLKDHLKTLGIGNNLLITAGNQ